MTLEETIDSFAALQPGWDSYAAVPINARTIALAKMVAATILPPEYGSWAVVPTADGHIALENNSDTKIDIIDIYAEE